jgi:formylglycine-generating enzyme required for sulfatase activity
MLINNRYEFDANTDRLGKGGFGRVYKAWDRIMEDYVAIKMVNPNEKDEIKEAIEQYPLVKEVLKARKLSHDSLVKYFDAFYFEITNSFDQEEQWQVAVMELVDGPDLSKFGFRALDNNRKKDIVGQILDGLGYLHNHHIIHRDIKPPNILVQKSGNNYRVKITDFGISKHIASDYSLVSNVIGSWEYMPPEQFQKGGKIGYNADIWSFGVMLYELFTGVLPFGRRSSGQTVGEIIYNIQHEAIPSQVETIAEPYRSLIKACLVKDRDQRPKAAQEIIDILSGKKGATQPISPATQVISNTNYTETINGVPLEMVFVQGGSFMMGATPEQGDDAGSNEKPSHKVSLDSFYIGKYPVTVGQLKQFIDETKYQTDADKGGGSNIWTGSEWKMQEGVNWECDEKGYVRTQDEYDYPVIHVSWNDAAAFSQWLSEKTGKNFRLPSEAEWEYAARGGQKTKRYKFSGSNNPEEVAWHYENSGSKPHPIGRKKPNELGIYDMSGNVWEWCEDDWHDNYNGAPTNRRAWIDSPRGDRRVLRGGSWDSLTRNCRVSYRGWDLPVYWNYDLGFRLAQDF